MIRFVFVVVSFLFVASLNAQENRTINGLGNNKAEPSFGSVGDVLLRYSTANYADGAQEINDTSLPSPREISNKLFDQQQDLPEAKQLSDYVWLFAKFLDHDISQVAISEAEVENLIIPADDEFFDQSAEIKLSRNKYLSGTGSGQNNPREYQNLVTSFIDGSQIYGSNAERANWLRTFSNGKLKMAKKTGNTIDLLPWNTSTGEFNDEIDYSSVIKMEDRTGSLSKYFVAGDDRVNENPLLIALHTLFVREHNRMCDELQERYPTWDDEKLYQRARKYVGAYLQAITYYEWLPAMGVYLAEYQGYDDQVEPVVMNEFSAAAFQIGHTMIDDDIIRMDNNGEIITEGNLKLNEAFYKPYNLVSGGGIDPYFKGMGTEIMQEMDCKVIDDLRNFISEESGVALDLASINIFRGRDRGLSDYNTLRTEFGLTSLRSFEDFSDNEEDIAILEQLYGNIDNIDAWVGMLSEPHINESAVFGELVMAIVKKQFKHLRDGDRFYFENDLAFSDTDIQAIKNTSLHDIIMRNTSITLMQPNVFEAMPHMDIPNLVIKEVNLEALIYPNPVRSRTTVKIYSDKQRMMSYKLYSHLGEVVKSGEKLLFEGQDNYLELEFDGNFSHGIYNLLIESETAYRNLKLVKQ